MLPNMGPTCMTGQCFIYKGAKSNKKNGKCLKGSKFICLGAKKNYERGQEVLNLDQAVIT